MNNTKLRVGQKVWVYNVFTKKLEPTHIKKVGSKYFYVEGYHPSMSKFNIDTLTENKYMGLSNTVYLNEEDYYEKIKYNKLVSKLNNFNFGTLSLDELTKVSLIIKESGVDKNVQRKSL